MEHYGASDAYSAQFVSLSPDKHKKLLPNFYSVLNQMILVFRRDQDFRCDGLIFRLVVQNKVYLVEFVMSGGKQSLF